jgi:para-nitrobenzyl esterase
MDKMNRRALLGSTLLTGGAVVSGILPRGFAASVRTKYETPEVETSCGKLRGVSHDGVHVFRGIPYGASTAGANRFLPPRKPESWTGVRMAFANGGIAPQITPPPGAIGSALRSNGAQSEDCLVLNVFTRGLNDGHRRPVMLWIHGGGYTYGSGGSLGYDGTNLARTGDVVVVSINHRLTIFGHLYLDEAGGSKYVGSANAGILDIVAALEWVRDNISHFGGDPANVTIFGQSGGGGKVSTLLAMPAAKGLFHKAIVESGSTLKQPARAEAQKNTESVLAKLGLKPNQIAELHTLPVDKILAAANGGRWSPVVDGTALPRDPFDPTAPDVSAGIPMLIGTAETEGSFFAPPELLSMDESTMRSRLQERLGGDAEQIIALFRKKRPKATPSELYFTISAFPTNANLQAERKSALGKAPAFLYTIAWRTPVEGGRRLAPHCIEIPFAFNNVWQMPEMVGTGPEIQELADRVSGAWVAFARTGNPSHALIPKWPSYNAADRATMLIDNEWKLSNDPNREERLAMAKFSRLPMF